MSETDALPGTFMIISILGFFISALWILDMSQSWGFAFMLVFALMFIASIVSMTRGDAEDELARDRKAFGDTSKALDEIEEKVKQASEEHSHEDKDLESEVAEAEAAAQQTASKGTADDLLARSTLMNKTKAELQEYAEDEFGVELSTDDLKKEMVEQLYDAVE
jgi:hypothetical protein